jgi:hypothetical protein
MPVGLYASPGDEPEVWDAPHYQDLCSLKNPPTFVHTCTYTFRFWPDASPPIHQNRSIIDQLEQWTSSHYPASHCFLKKCFGFPSLLLVIRIIKNPQAACDAVLVPLVGLPSLCLIRQDSGNTEQGCMNNFYETKLLNNLKFPLDMSPLIACQERGPTSFTRPSKSCTIGHDTIAVTYQVQGTWLYIPLNLWPSR